MNADRPGMRQPAVRPGQVSAAFVDRASKYGASPRLLRKLGEVATDDPMPRDDAQPSLASGFEMSEESRLAEAPSKMAEKLITAIKRGNVGRAIPLVRGMHIRDIEVQGLDIIIHDKMVGTTGLYEVKRNAWIDSGSEGESPKQDLDLPVGRPLTVFISSADDDVHVSDLTAFIRGDAGHYRGALIDDAGRVIAEGADVPTKRAALDSLDILIDEAVDLDE
ncbi:hypothetical protein ACWF0M_14210 [Kribbella sp. NPDC055110]